MDVNFADQIAIDTEDEDVVVQSMPKHNRGGSMRTSATRRPREGRMSASSRRARPPPKTKSRSLSPEQRRPKVLPGRTKSRSLSPERRRPDHRMDRKPNRKKNGPRRRKSRSLSPDHNKPRPLKLERSMSRSLSPDRKNRRHSKRGAKPSQGSSSTQQTFQASSSSFQLDSSWLETGSNKRPHKRNSLTQFESTVDIPVGRRKHQARRESANATLQALVQANIELQDNLPESDDESVVPEQETPKNKKSSEWKKAKKVLTKMTKKIIGKQAELFLIQKPRARTLAENDSLVGTKVTFQVEEESGPMDDLASLADGAASRSSVVVASLA